MNRNAIKSLGNNFLDTIQVYKKKYILDFDFQTLRELPESAGGFQTDTGITNVYISDTSLYFLHILNKVYKKNKTYAIIYDRDTGEFLNTTLLET